MTQRNSRDSDERLLDMIRLRASGQSTVSIAKHYGIGQATVSHNTNAVRDADLWQGDPQSTQEQIKGAYW